MEKGEKMAQKKYVYFYGVSKELTEGDSSMKAVLGGKGANLAEMANANLPVPPGFTISTEACAYYSKTGGKYPKEMEKQLKNELSKLEKNMGKKLGDPSDPLLVSVRSGWNPIARRPNPSRHAARSSRSLRIGGRRSLLPTVLQRLR